MLKMRFGELGPGVVGALLVMLAGAPATASVTGICPDGSVFIIPDTAPAPCSGAKEVEPSNVPPMRPEYLPRPYTWQLYQMEQDPNNPYNLIDLAREIEKLRRESESQPSPESQLSQPGGGTQGGWEEGPTTTAAAPPVSAAPPTIGPLDLGLGHGELRDLYQIVELSQEVSPAAFERETADGNGVIRLAVARSSAFEARMRDAWSGRGGLGGGQVLVFTAVSMQPEAFHANLTFVQEHLSFQPDPLNPRQLGLLQGRLGELDSNQVVLGYVIVPANLDLDAPLDLYWNDRRITVRFPSA